MGFFVFFTSPALHSLLLREKTKVSARCNYRLHVDLITNPPPINELRSMHDYIHNVGGGGISGTIKLQRAGLLNQQPANSEHYITKQRGGGGSNITANKAQQECYQFIVRFTGI